MLQTKNLIFSYPETHISFKLADVAMQPGQSLAIIGASGCGKTTLLSVLGGIERGYQGELMINGINLHSLSERQARLFRLRNVGFVFQDFLLLKYLSVTDNILYPYRINGQLCTKEKVVEQAKYLAQLFQIDHCLQSFGSDISKGEAQRAAICRGLIHKPQLVIADEPTSHLDPDNKALIFEQLHHYCRQEQAILVVATHDYQQLDMFDTVVEMKAVNHHEKST